ncbi:MAG: hypothetical protein WD846_03345 [Patescibacteria group bacterium]
MHFTAKIRRRHYVPVRLCDIPRGHTTGKPADDNGGKLEQFQKSGNWNRAHVFSFDFVNYVMIPPLSGFVNH